LAFKLHENGVNRIYELIKEKKIMNHEHNFESYVKPHYTALDTVSKSASANFSNELMLFISQYPEFLQTKSHLDFLRYCFDHYINCDPLSRDLPLQEKFKQAGEMAKNFMGIVIGEKA
jgi:hypothetical protein